MRGTLSGALGFVPARRAALAALLFAGACLPASIAAAQGSGITLGPDMRAQQPVSRAVPDENTLARLVWGTMVALDNANRTENYSVLHTLGSTGFQRANSAGQLSRNFAALRAKRVDIGRAVLSTPSYYIPPRVDAEGKLRLRGGFDYRPQSIRFDIIYAQERGGWRIDALSVVQMRADAPKN